MTEALDALVPLAVALPLLVALATLLGRSAIWIDRVGRVGGVAAAVPALVIAATALTRADEPALTGLWWRVDGRGAVFLATTAVVGAIACAVSPAYLRGTPTSRAGSLASRRLYWSVMLAFWAILLAVPLADDLGLAWILLEASTAASALLIAFTGKASAVEAGWKYLVLTSLGLAFTLFGIVILSVQMADEAGGSIDLGWDRIGAAAPGLSGAAIVTAYVLMLAGLATKGGWAPVHNWLPDAHSEAPPPVSALLSAALLPTVALVAWRLGAALAPAVGVETVRGLFVAFGLISLAVAVPFLWKPLPWKRLLAYSSLEHMGILVLAIGIDNPIATAGALIHVAGHGVAKALGFAAAVPLLRYQPAAGRRPARGLAQLSRPLAAAVSVSLAALAGLPPSPLFISEILVLWGAADAGLVWVAVVAALLLALGFLGMGHALVEGLAGRPSGRRPTGPRGTRLVLALTCVSVVLLLALTALAHRLPDSTLVLSLFGGVIVTVAERAVAPAQMRDAVEAVLARGGTVDALFAAGPLGAREVRYACATGEGELIIRCAADEGVVPTLVDRLPHLAWDEREAHDLYGIDFAGHRPLRPLVHHPPALDAWTTPVAGDDVHQVAVGPVHAGIIESGHFRFHAVGERIIHLDARLFHKHRDLERLAEGRSLVEMIEVLRHACGACAVANTVAGAHAAEQAAGLWPSPELSRVRTLLLELERLYNHLNDIGQICAGVGLAAGAMAFAALKERAQRINLALTGHRFLFGAVTFAGSELAISRDQARVARDRIRELAGETRAAWGDLSRDPSLRDRTRGAGVLTRADALALAVRGPAARASGVSIDARSRSPRLDHDAFAPAVGGGEGDVAARLEIRALELEAVFAMLDRLLDGAVAACGTIATGPAAVHGVGRVESPRGESVCVVETEGDVVRRVHLRTASYANWPAVTVAAGGTILPDFPLINKSFELCYACVDR